MTTGAEVVGREIRALGIDCAFGVAGTQNASLLEGFRRAGVRFVPTVSEVGAAFMANGHHRASGKVAVLATVGGPGFTMALTGVAEALEDSAALLWLSCGRQTPSGKRFGLQALDEATIAEPLVRAIRTVSRPQGVRPALQAALKAATSEEPGPVLLRFEPNALTGNVTEPSGGGPRDGTKSDARGLEPEATAPPPVDAPAVDQLAHRLEEARKPVLLLGQGAADAAHEIRNLVRRRGAAVVATTSGRGVVAEDDPRVLSVDGPGRDVETLNAFLDHADLVVALGAKLSENGSQGFRLRLDPRRLVRVDQDPRVLGANYPASLVIQAAVTATVREVERRNPTSGAGSHGWSVAELDAWRRRLDEAPDPWAGHLKIRHGTPSDLPSFVRRIRDALPRDAVVVTDSGRHQMVVRRHLTVTAPRSLLIPSDFQSMGFGVPAAVGARMAMPHRPVLAVVGDGGLAMTGLELLSAVRAGLTLPVLVFSDGELGLIRDQQVTAWGREVGTRTRPFSPKALADAAGARHRVLRGNLRDAMEGLMEEPSVTVAELPVVRTSSGRSHGIRALTRAYGRRILESGGLRADSKAREER